MKAPRRARRSTGAVAIETSEPRIVQHPDGFYWLVETHEVGPFSSFDDARADMQAAEMSDESGVEPGETLEQAEADIGVEGWIDPDTGAPAEQQSPRIEEH
jgi:hypothetical protein